jgi:glycerol-3-phosphate cytidylyltransferase-like family protein
MGGVMYSKHTGHFSSLRINSWVGDDIIVVASPADSSTSVSVKVCTNSSLQLTIRG